MKQGFVFTILSATLWGFTGTVAKLLFRGSTGPLVLVEVRLTLSAALLGLFLAATQRRLLRLERRDVPYFVVLGVLGMAAVQFTYLYTMSQTTVATAVFLQSLAPSLIFLHAALFKVERLTGPKLTALLFALAGSVLMIQGRGGGRGLYPWGLASGLASAFFAAFYTIYSKRALTRYHPVTVTFWALAFGAVPWWFILPPGRLLSMGFVASDLLFFLYIAVFSTVVPFVLYFRGLQDLTPGQAGIISTLEPVVATLTAFLVLGETLSWVRFLGAALVLAGIALLRLLPSAEGAREMGRRSAAALVVALALGWGAGGGARAMGEPVFRGFAEHPAGTMAVYRLTVESRAAMGGEVLNLLGVTAEFRLATHAPDAEGRRLVELVYTKLQVEEDASGRMAEVARQTLDQPFRLIFDRDGNLQEYTAPPQFPTGGFDPREVIRGPLPEELRRVELRVGEKVSVPLRTQIAVQGLEVVTEGETTLEYAGRVEVEGGVRDLVLLTTESRAGLTPGGASHYVTDSRGRLYGDPTTGALAWMVLETVVTPPSDIPTLPIVGTTVEIQLVSQTPLSQ